MMSYWNKWNSVPTKLGMTMSGQLCISVILSDFLQQEILLYTNFDKLQKLD